MVQLLSFVLATASVASAYKTFVTKVPNGDKVSGSFAIGHDDPSGGGPRNAFGLAFATAGAKWTPELCKADSDNDGATNGEELGDACCTWTAGATLASGFKATSPGTADKFTPDQLKALKCGASVGSSASNSTADKKADVTAPPTTAPKASSAASASSAVAVAVVAFFAARQ